MYGDAMTTIMLSRILTLAGLFGALAAFGAPELLGAANLQGAGAPQATHDHQAHLDARGEKVMGFDQRATVHHFYLHEDGGTIQVTVKEANDRVNLTAIRAHLPELVKRFAAGDFSMPHVIHDNDTPGTATMARLRDRIAYAYENVPGGGRVRISTRHARALAAVHEFLRFQITDHKTGDSLEVRPRG